MGLFNDKKYESLDEISKMIEPWENPFDAILAKLPDELEVDVTMILSVLDRYDVRDALLVKLLNSFLSKDEFKKMYKLIEIHSHLNLEKILSIKWDEYFQFNAATKEKQGSLKIIKERHSFCEADIKIYISQYAKDGILNQYSCDHYISDSLRTLYELVTGRKYESDSRSKKHLIRETRTVLLELIEEDKWRIRSYDLYIKLINWIEDYCRNGSTHCMANIMKIKIMTYNGKAIYSIGEEQ